MRPRKRELHAPGKRVVGVVAVLVHAAESAIDSLQDLREIVLGRGRRSQALVEVSGGCFRQLGVGRRFELDVHDSACGGAAGTCLIEHGAELAMHVTPSDRPRPPRVHIVESALGLGEPFALDRGVGCIVTDAVGE